MHVLDDTDPIQLLAVVYDGWTTGLDHLAI
jgi:hypothetical protein